MIKVLQDGVVYVHGRDRHFRPLVYVSAGKFERLKGKISNDDVISIGVIMFEFLEKFMYV